MATFVTQGQGGTLCMESTEGAGATFVITFPHEATRVAATAKVSKLTGHHGEGRAVLCPYYCVSDSVFTGLYGAG